MLFYLAKDSDDTKIEIDFSAEKDVLDAYELLFVTCQKVAKPLSKDFEIIRNSCVNRTSGVMCDMLKHTTDINHLFKVLADNKYCNWMDVRILKGIAIACENKQLQSLIENYKTVIYSKTLCEVGNGISYLVRDQYDSELQTGLGEKYPYSNMTVKELMNTKPWLAKKIAMLIADSKEQVTGSNM